MNFKNQEAFHNTLLHARLSSNSYLSSITLSSTVPGAGRARGVAASAFGAAIAIRVRAFTPTTVPFASGTCSHIGARVRSAGFQVTPSGSVAAARAVGAHCKCERFVALQQPL
eukprot:SAG11_NODE_5696_length_1484_cov_1.779783_1_plen_113_part_00